MPRLRLGFLASHGGSNVQAIVDACKRGELDAEPRVVISNNRDSQVLERARAEDIPWYHLSSRTHPEPEELDAAVLAALTEHDVDTVILAGYMKKLGPRTLERYRGRVLNVHPALLPQHGGQGMYGIKVHEAVLAARDEVSGATIHLADEEYDRGPIVAQAEVTVSPNDTPETLAARVLEVEHSLYVDTLRRISRGELTLP